MGEHYEYGEDKELDALRDDLNFSKIIKKASQIGNKSLISKKKGGKC